MDVAVKTGGVLVIGVSAGVGNVSIAVPMVVENVRATAEAALKLVSPGWFAVIVQEPADENDVVKPSEATVQPELPDAE